MLLNPDNPIKERDEDILQRDQHAEFFSKQIQCLDLSEGAVVGVMGTWGSGKTSFLNLLASHLEGCSECIIRFNPWLFSGAENLIELFFTEIGKELNQYSGTLKEVSSEIMKLGVAFSPLLKLIPGCSIFGNMIPELQKLISDKPSVVIQKQKIEDALTDLTKPIIVLLDDIDRLTPDETREVFKLIRLIGRFPYVLYVVAFDRAKVEQALEIAGISDGEYLDKIVQLVYDLPQVPQESINKYFLTQLDNSVNALKEEGEVTIFNEDVWDYVFHRVLKPQLKTLRNVNRFVTSSSCAIRCLHGKIELSDILALESIRVFLPRVFQQIVLLKNELTDEPQKRFEATEVRHRRYGKNLEVLTGEGFRDHYEVIKHLIDLLFPAAGQYFEKQDFSAAQANCYRREWRLEKRVANFDNLRHYLECLPNSNTINQDHAQKIVQIMDRESELRDYISNLDEQEVKEVVGLLIDMNDQFQKKHVISASSVLLNLLPTLKDHKLNIYDFSISSKVKALVCILILTLDNETEVIDKVNEIYSKLNSLVSKMELLTVLVENRVHQKRELLSQSTIDELIEKYLTELKESEPEKLHNENSLFLIYFRAQLWNEGNILPPDEPEVTYKILLGSISVHYEGVGENSKPVRFLSWDNLISIFGSEAELKKRVSDLLNTDIQGENELLELAKMYLEGFRPQTEQLEVKII